MAQDNGPITKDRVGLAPELATEHTKRKKVTHFTNKES